MLRPPFSNALILTGPTASGKTGLAIRLAREMNAEIISMDSMALYRHMDIGTAKPTEAERRAVPHHLIDVLEPWESASVAWWLQRAEECCRDIESGGKQVLIVGGTPLYLKAILFGLFDGPAADAGLRQRLTQEANEHGTAELHRRLGEVDPEAGRRIHPNDLRRIIRALEVYHLTGRPISSWQREWQDEPAFPSGPARTVVLDLPRSELHERINRRVEEMFAAGLIEEARSLRQLDQPLSMEASQAVGYREVFAYLDGRANLHDTMVQVQTRTRQFAKRQMTWFRHLPGCELVTSELTWKLWQPKMSMEAK